MSQIDLQSQYYYGDNDDLIPKSPGLEAVKPKSTPSPSPTPEAHRQILIPGSNNVSSPFSKRRRKFNLKPQPSLGDLVLVRSMAPDRPDIAQHASEHLLPSDGEERHGEDDDEDDEDDEEMMDNPSTTAVPVSSDSAPASLTQTDASSLQATARRALSTNSQSAALPAKFSPLAHRDSVVELDNNQSRATHDIENGDTHESATGPTANGTRLSVNGADTTSSTNGLPPPAATSSNITGERHASVTNNHPHDDSIATSPNLGKLAIPPSKASPSQKLAAIQPPQSPRDGPSSPNQARLPSFKQISELAGSGEQDLGRTNGYGGHRPSISSSTQSPTTVARQLSISSISPGTAFPNFGAPSPINSANETSARGDIFLRAGQHLSLFSTRRPSQASDSGPFSATIHSASTTNESYASSDGLSPGSQPTPVEGQGQRMSIDGALTSRTLPPLPTGPHIQHVPAHGAGGFKCDHLGCTAPPFQTQYLLNSHANVHTQNRPHFCPVPDCPRGEAGKGFKRKNEMIRHGLVHQSPGYVCPFCPDREHKYPRPDNLQRHVRVHHVDKDKDDPQLREVLAQRPEGGSRGRRRRMGSG
ncbi:hypothetical protein B0J11DRAFT_291364 [Dendryphion nanum]|uniref:C2H2-type domain-containing protein n=1 Tax=Dendryphion nanum TaxID=256645 RepID=A0A9P9DVJ4_9PLEO|nr:hypothetical protein B0J11DRAFT_291364 [Dendryphion nanum]